MQHTDDDDRVRDGPVVDGVGTVERDTQFGGERLTGRPAKREISDRLERRFDRRDKTGRDRLGCFGGDVCPDRGEVFLGGIGEAKR
jgi:hypothetical protein